MKNFKLHISSWLLIILFLVGSVLYPFWLIDGYLDNLYLKIMVFISCYGGLIASIVWYIKFIRESK